MIVGLLKVEIFIPESGSLKSKRFVVKSLKERIKGRFNVSVAEEANNLWQRTVIGVAGVSDTESHVREIMQKVKDMIFSETDIEVLNHSTEIF
ncbi:MAG: DUF503 domain-containing protein [bacterium]